MTREQHESPPTSACSSRHRLAADTAAPNRPRHPSTIHRAVPADSFRHARARRLAPKRPPRCPVLAASRSLQTDRSSQSACPLRSTLVAWRDTASTSRHQPAPPTAASLRSSADECVRATGGDRIQGEKGVPSSEFRVPSWKTCLHSELGTRYSELPPETPRAARSLPLRELPMPR